MNSQNHLRLLEQFRRHETVIRSLMASMMTSIEGHRLIDDREAQKAAIRHLCRKYPFVEVIYSVDGSGVQLQDSVYGSGVKPRRRRYGGRGRDRSHRPYMVAARDAAGDVAVTQPYLSSATHRLAISGAQRLARDDSDEHGYLVLNFNLEKLIAYLNGDETLRKAHPYFQVVYAIIGSLLILVALLLLVSAGSALLDAVLAHEYTATSTFGSVVMLTLASAIFDLGKTILEEEVLTRKDINHYDTARRTITRFMTAIVIAVSIESLLLMFKSLLGGAEAQVISAVWMLMAAVALLASLGIYLRLSRE